MRRTVWQWCWLLIALAIGFIALLELKNLRIPGGSSGTPLQGYRQVDLRDLEDVPFDGETGTERDLPDAIRMLDGKQVAITGLQYVDYTSDPQVDQFQLVRRFRGAEHRAPTVQQRVFCHAHPGTKLAVYDGQVRVLGTFHIKVERDDKGRVVSLFTMTVDSIDSLQPAAK